MGGGFSPPPSSGGGGDVQGQIDELVSSVSLLTTRVSDAETDISGLSSADTALDGRLDAAESDITSLSDTLDGAIDDIAAVDAKVGDVDNGINVIDVTDLVDAVNQLQGLISNAQSAADSAGADATLALSNIGDMDDVYSGDTNLVDALSSTKTLVDQAQSQADQASADVVTLMTDLSGFEYTESWTINGTWSTNVDGARGSGGGLIGGNVLLTLLGNTDCIVDDGGVLSQLQSGVAGRVAWKLIPDTPQINVDGIFIGYSTPFCEVAADVGTAMVDTGNVWTWKYWNGSAWVALPIAFDNTNAANNDRKTFERDGAFCFKPPVNWAKTTVNGKNQWWIRGEYAIDNATTKPIMNNQNLEIVSPPPESCWVVPNDGRIQGILFTSRSATLGTVQDTKLVIINWTAMAGLDSGRTYGECVSAEITWTKGKKRFMVTGVNLDVKEGDLLSPLIIQRDGTNEPSDVTMTMDFNPLFASGL